MTVHRLIAAAVRSGKPSAQVQERHEEDAPAQTEHRADTIQRGRPIRKMIRISGSVTEGIPDGDYLSARSRFRSIDIDFVFV